MINIIVECLFSVGFAIAGLWAVNTFLDKRKNEQTIDCDVIVSKRLHIGYFVAEAVACVLFVIFFQTIYADTTLLHQLKLLVLIFILFPTALVDYKVQLIPNDFMLGALLIRGVIYLIEFFVYPSIIWNTLKETVIAAVLIAGFFLIIHILFKNSVGMGDVKLFAIIGLYQGIWGATNAVFFSLLVSFFLSVVLLITKKVTKKDCISFAPSILLGTTISILLSGY